MSSQSEQGNIWRIAAGSAISLLLVQIALAVYKAYLGPLAKFPGPKRYALARMTLLYDNWRGLDAESKNDLHKTYGPVVRIAPNSLSFNTAQAWRDIYGHRINGRFSLSKDSDFYGNPPRGVHSIITADDANHARMRRILAHSFSDKSLKDQEPVFKVWTDLLVQKLREHAVDRPNEATDLVKRWNCATFDIMGDLTFAESLGMLENGEYSSWVRAIYDNVKLGTKLRQLFLVPAVGPIAQWIIKQIPAATKARNEHLRYSDERVNRRLAKQPDHHDLWTEVLIRGEKNDLTYEEMLENANLFMLAGTETTATLLSGLTFYLLKNPESMARLVEEIRTEFSSLDDITVDRLQRMPYLHACIEEGLRIYPPVPIGLPRVVPGSGMHIDGAFVPGGTSVSVSQWATYRSDKNWTLPDEFHPERWLDDPRFKSDDKGSFQPFSCGPRNCIGRNLAYHEARILLASVLHQFDLELDARSDNWHGQQKVYSLWEKVPLWVRLRPRASA